MQLCILSILRLTNRNPHTEHGETVTWMILPSYSLSLLPAESESCQPEKQQFVVKSSDLCILENESSHRDLIHLSILQSGRVL